MPYPLPYPGVFSRRSGGGFLTESATSVEMGEVEFLFSEAVSVGVFPSGQPFYIAKTGATVSEPTPAASTLDDEPVSGAMLNPTQDVQAYDGRMQTNKFNAAAAASFPLSMSPGDTLIKAASVALSDSNARRGIIAQDGWASLICLSAAPPANAVGYIALGWTGRGPATAILPNRAGATTLQGLIDLINTRNITGLPPVADVIARFQYYPAFAQASGSGGTGYEASAPRNFNGVGPTSGSNWNYGQNISVLMGAVFGHLVHSGTSDPDKATLLARAIVNGGEWFEAFSRGVEQEDDSVFGDEANGGHKLWSASMALVYLWATGQDAKAREFRRLHGTNISNLFLLNPAIRDLLAPHGSGELPAISRRRTITAVSGTSITFSSFTGGSGNDPARNNFVGLEIVRESDGASAVLTVAPANTATKPYVYTIDAQPDPVFAVDDVVYMRLPSAVSSALTSDWQVAHFVDGARTEGWNFAKWVPSVGQSYRVSQDVGVQMLGVRAIGAFPHDLDGWEDYVVSAETADFPTSGHNLPTTLGSAYRTISGDVYSWQGDFWTNHSTAILALDNKISGKPAAPATGSFNVTTGLTPGRIIVTITTLPDDNGSPRTGIEVSVDGGVSWEALAANPNVSGNWGHDAPPGTVDVAIRFVNANGPGPRSVIIEDVVVDAAEEPFATDIALDAFATGPGGALPVFSGLRSENSGMILVTGTGEPGAAIQARIVLASDSSEVTAWASAGAVNGSGVIETYVRGAPRSFNAYKVEVRYTEATAQNDQTPNSCYVGWVVSIIGQSDLRSLSNGNLDGVPNVTMTQDNRVRFITVDRAADPANSVAVVIDLAGEIGPERAPVAALANVLMSEADDGPIILMGHSVNGSPPRSITDDSVTDRDWSDEALVLAAGQPHWIDRTRPVVVDNVRFAFSSAGAYSLNNAENAFGLIVFGMLADGTAAVRDATYTNAEYDFGHNITTNHFMTDMFNFASGSKFTLAGMFSSEDQTDAHNLVMNNTFFAPFCAGVPAGPARIGNVQGEPGADNLWSNTTHPSTTAPHGANLAMSREAFGILRAAGLVSAPVYFDWIDWGDGEGDDQRYVHVGIDGEDVTTHRYELDDTDPPGSFGQVLGFVVNGANSRDATLVTFKGQRRVRLQKPGLAEWNGADTIQTVWDANEDPITPTHRNTYFQIDWPCVETGNSTFPASPLWPWLTADPTLLDNPLPAPSVTLPTYVTTLTRETNISATTATDLGNVTSTGQPLLLVLAMRGTAVSTSTPVTAATLGGVDIMSHALVNSAANRARMVVFRVPSPASGSLALNITMAEGVSCAAIQVFEEPSGLGSVQESGGEALGGTSATRSMLNSANVATSDNTVVLGFTFWTRNAVIDYVSSTLTKMDNASGGEIKVSNGATNHLSLFGVRQVVNNAGGEGTIVSDASVVGGVFWIKYDPPA